MNGQVKLGLSEMMVLIRQILPRVASKCSIQSISFVHSQKSYLKFAQSLRNLRQRGKAANIAMHPTHFPLRLRLCSKWAADGGR